MVTGLENTGLAMFSRRKLQLAEGLWRGFQAKSSQSQAHAVDISTHLSPTVDGARIGYQAALGGVEQSGFGQLLGGFSFPASHVGGQSRSRFVTG